MFGQSSENNLVKIVSKISVWVAPAPSAYFVARSATKHLGVIRPFDAVIALVIETLGISTIHTALWLYSWNQESMTPAGNVRRGRTLASWLEIGLSIATGLLYLLTAVSLTVVLEVYPNLAIYAPALFPLFSIVGAVNLALISRQENRESALQADKKPSTESVKELTPTVTIVDNGRQGMKQARKEVLLTLLQSNSQLGASEAAGMIGVSRQSIYGYLNELESDGLIEKTESGIKVK